MRFLQAAACIFFTPFFSAVYSLERLIITDNLCTKQGNLCLKSKEVSNQERVIMARARYMKECLHSEVFQFL